jgi:signal peptidase I
MAETTRAHEAAPEEPDDAPDRPLEDAGRRPDASDGGRDERSGGDLGPPKHRRSRDAEPEGEERRWRFVGSTPFLILVALGVAILVKSFVIQAFYIPSESMVPTLEVGDRVFVNKFLFDGGDIHRGDVIVFENPNQ